jgi:hypothetical protein
MGITRIHSLLVHPGKGLTTAPPIGGTSVALGGKLGAMLSDTYDRAPAKCDIEILFMPDAEGRQQNPCRDEMVAYAKRPGLPSARKIADRLQSVTTNRSGLGLLFLMSGKEGAATRLVVSRFPADQGIIAEENRDDLSVEFIERVFMKSARSYKSVVFESASFERGFWDGKAIDRQISGGTKELSDYWIRDFMLADLRTTAAAGTKRVAVALKSAIKTAGELPVRQELVAAAALLRNRDQQVVTGRLLVESIGLSEPAAATLQRELPRPELMDETFTFDSAEFDKHVQFRAVELDNGGMLIADDDDFDDVFDAEAVDDAGVVRFSTEGRVVNETLRNRK